MGTFTCEKQGANTILVYSLDMNENIDTLAAGMVANNRIEGILSPGFVQNNMMRQLKYNISSKITLKKYFSGTVKKKQVIGIFRSLTEIFIQAEKFLLGEESFLLDWEHIYVNASSADAYLLCFPIEKEERERISYYELIHKMIYQLKFDESENCVYVATLINFINKKESFTFRSFLETLRKIELEIQMKEKRRSIRETAPAGKMISDQGNIIQAAAAASPIPVPPVLAEEEKETEKKKSKRKEKKEKREERKKEKKEKRFSLSFGRKKKEEVKQPSFAIPGQPYVTPKDTELDSSSKMSCIPKDSAPKKQVRTEEPMREAVLPPQEPYGSMGLKNEETRAAVFVKSNVQRNVMITRMRNGMTAEINKEVFRIGKSNNFNDFCISDNGTVSRSHADILLMPDGVYIRDNHSLNHTYVNEQIVQSGTQIKLSDGDSIRLSDEDFVISIR